MLDALVGIIVALLVIAGVLIIIGPSSVWRRLRAVRLPGRLPSLPEPRSRREVVPPALNPKTQRVMVAAARLANWLRTHDQDDMAREIRNAAARMTGNEAAGLYALQSALRRVRLINVSDHSSQERLKALANELRTAVQDRFEQLELLPRRRP